MEWQPIETAPKDEYIYVYLLWIEKAVPAIYRPKSRRGSKCGWKVHPLSAQAPFYLLGNSTPTHWMPLPPSPAE